MSYKCRKCGNGDPRAYVSCRHPSCPCAIKHEPAVQAVAKPTDTAIVEAMAASDAAFDGRSWGGMSRAARQRYTERSAAALAAGRGVR